jgi:SSS family solute:Na+ symporter
MSGWMLMGLPGAMYVTGLSSAWLAVGLTIGAYVNYLVVAPRLRTYTEVANDAITIPDFFENRFNDTTRICACISHRHYGVFHTVHVGGYGVRRKTV